MNFHISDHFGPLSHSRLLSHLGAFEFQSDISNEACGQSIEFTVSQVVNLNLIRESTLTLYDISL